MKFCVVISRCVNVRRIAVCWCVCVCVVPVVTTIEVRATLYGSYSLNGCQVGGDIIALASEIRKTRAKRSSGHFKMKMKKKLEKERKRGWFSGGLSVHPPWIKRWKKVCSDRRFHT